MKRLALIILTILGIMMTTTTVFAATMELGETKYDLSSFEYFFDDACLLSDDEYIEVEKMAREMSEELGFGIYFLSVDDMWDYGYTDAFELAKDWFLHEDFGYGPEGDGIFLVLSMEDRDFYLVTHGYGEEAFSDAARDHVCDEFIDDFGDNEWYEGIRDYIECAGELTRRAQAGDPYGIKDEMKGAILVCAIIVGICFIVSLFIAKLIMNGYVNEMNNAVLATEAKDYITAGSVVISEKSDSFEYETVHRETIKSSSGSGGGYSHSSGGGFSGSGGKF